MGHTEEKSSKNLRSVALVLSGGGALGAAHVGFASELLKHYQVDFYAGTSAGAIIAAALACGMETDEISQQLHQKRLLTLAFDLSFRGSGLIRGKKILDLFRKVYDDRKFSDLPQGIELFVCTTDFMSGELIVINSGSIAEAVRASVSIPGIIEPVLRENRLLVDGGLVSNLPLGPTLSSYQGKKVIAVDVCSCLPSENDPHSQTKRFTFRKSIERCMRIMFRNQQAHFINDPRVRLFRPDLINFNAFDITKLQQIEKKGVEAFDLELI